LHEGGIGASTAPVPGGWVDAVARWWLECPLREPMWNSLMPECERAASRAEAPRARRDATRAGISRRHRRRAAGGGTGPQTRPGAPGIFQELGSLAVGARARPGRGETLVDDGARLVEGDGGRRFRGWP
jgi:hypothetical protein